MDKKKLIPKKDRFVPITPGGTILIQLEKETEQEAWDMLLKDAAHMPYKSIKDFKKRGYKIIKFA